MRKQYIVFDPFEDNAAGEYMIENKGCHGYFIQKHGGDSATSDDNVEIY